MSKSTPLSVQNAFNDKLKNSQESAAQVKEAHRTTAQAIKSDTTLSDTGRRQKLDALNYETKMKIDALKDSQQTFVKGLRDKVEKELGGNLPADPAIVVIRRDAADRARKLDPKESLVVLRDATASNDPDLANAIGVRAGTPVGRRSLRNGSRILGTRLARPKRWTTSTRMGRALRSTRSSRA